MKTSYSDVKYMKKAATFQAQAMALNPPAIRFCRKKEESSKGDDEASRNKMTIKLDPDNEDSDSLQGYTTIFGAGTAEDCALTRGDD